MNVSILILLILSVCGAQAALLQFEKMIKCAQPQVRPSIYLKYGCWCGLGGYGQPKDATDLCCYFHDRCYEASRELPACRPIIDWPYLKEYKFTCSNKQLTCSDSNDECQAAACECDRFAAHCFARYSASYNSKYKKLIDFKCIRTSRTKNEGWILELSLKHGFGNTTVGREIALR